MNEAPVDGEMHDSTLVSVGMVARNEEAVIGATLNSLLEQSIFGELNRRGWKCEVLLLANGCTDRTVEIAQEVFRAHECRHPDREAIRARVVELAQRGKINAWNQFVHHLAAARSSYFFLMDADILIHRKETLWNMLCALEEDAEANVAVDRPCKHILFKSRKSLWDHISLGASRLTASAEAQLCGQLYCIRAEIARRIYLPQDLGACEDGFIKTLVCSDFLTGPCVPGRIRLAREAEHTFEGYSSPADLVRNQKRQIMAQTVVHVLVDGYLKSRPLSEREQLAETLKEKDRNDPSWLKRMVREHLQRTRFWRMYPGMGSTGLRRLRRLKLRERLVCFPAALAGSFLTLFSGLLAFAALKDGCMHYWPQAQREELTKLKL